MDLEDFLKKSFKIINKNIRLGPQLIKYIKLLKTKLFYEFGC